MVFTRRLAVLSAAAGLVACARSSVPPASRPNVDMRPAVPVRDTTSPPGALPAVPAVRGPLLQLRVVYPPPDAVVRAKDSSFLLGSIGSGDATLTINSHPVRVWPNGAWLAWIPLPPDSLMRFHLVARRGAESVELDYDVRRGGWAPTPPAGLWLDSASLAPRGRVWWPAGEYLTLTARASEGATLRMILPDSSVVPLVRQSRLEEIPEAIRAFDRDTGNLTTAVRRDLYVGVIRGRALGPSPGPVLPDPSAPPIAAGLLPAPMEWPVVEAIQGGDTIRARWPLQVALLDTLPTLVETQDSSRTDGITTGRAVPGGTYHWFFPDGTRAAVSGRMNDHLRLQLAPESEAWISAVEAKPVPGLAAAPAVVGSVRLTPMPDRVRVRIPLSHRVPYQVAETDRGLTLRLYGALGDVNWIQYGSADTLVRRASWDQDRREEVTLTFDLSEPLWGYHAGWDRGDLLLDVRRPPHRSGGSLKGWLIAVDPGHPPGGSNGPTGLREAEANLAIGLLVKQLLEAAGARVFITRTEDVPIDLWPRVNAAEQAGADLLVSIHNNAVPDGVNPLTNSGASVYYNQPRSLPLARAVQAELVRRLGVRDLGVGRGDLALVRTTWMPSILTEGLFIMVPEQEAALRSPRGQRLYADAVVEGIRRFLRDREPES
ncbi:MAG TPA: N-acetylmuramoyl-L-alanine amidase [Gemmatimonadales bacterium]